MNWEEEWLFFDSQGLSNNIIALTLNRIEQMSQCGKETSRMVDEIFDWVDDALISGYIEDVNKILDFIDADRLCLQALLAFAAITYSFRDRIRSREDFMSRARYSLKKRGLYKQGLAAGL